MSVATSSLLPEPRPRRHLEADFQAQIMEFLGWALPDGALAHHSPGEGKRTKRAQGELKRSGYQAGWPDIEVVWRGQPRPIFLELKVPGGTVSPTQRYMHRRLEYCGATVAVCRTLDEVEASLRAAGIPLQATASGWRRERQPTGAWRPRSRAYEQAQLAHRGAA